jgi:ketosteroid isomerase-like protein
MSIGRTGIVSRVFVVLLLVAPACLAQGKTIEPSARKGIDAGNQAWIGGMKSGDAAPIAATYADDALDCDPTGECVRGRAAIEERTRALLARWGRAKSASVSSKGAVQEGGFVYEWGSAEASFANGKKIADRYLTVWQRQQDGSWKIFRNMVIPHSPRRQ